MKRIASLLLVAAFVLGSAVSAKADGIDVKVKGQWDFAFGWNSNAYFNESYMTAGQEGRIAKDGDSDRFTARQRIRTQINFITSEYLQAVLMLEIGGLDWGRDNGKNGRSSGGGLDTDGVNIETKRAYLDWMIPQTEVSVRMGLQGMNLPATRMGNPVLEADVAGITIASPITDWLSATVFWARPFDSYSDGSRRNLSDETDYFGIVLPFEFEGVSFSPWFMYGFIGANSGYYDYHYGDGGNANSVTEKSSAKAWWLGFNFELNIFDPLTFSLDAIYGNLNRANLGGLNYQDKWTLGDGDNFKTRGWYIGATLDYKLDCMTPGIFGWYASGDDWDDWRDKGELGRLPIAGTDGGNFAATSFGMAGYYGVGNHDDWVRTIGTGTGTWGIGIQLADVTFIDDLSHTLRLAYYRGTNDADIPKSTSGYAVRKYTSDALYLTDKDYVWEINFDHEYKIYENLTAVLELGWLRLHADKDTWTSMGGMNYGNYTSGLKENQNAWKAELNFRYSF